MSFAKAREEQSCHRGACEVGFRRTVGSYCGSFKPYTHTFYEQGAMNQGALSWNERGTRKKKVGE